MNTPSINNSKYIFKETKFKNFVARVGNAIPEKISDFCDLTTKASMKRTTQFTILAVCVLIGRYIQARNDDERREILTRDVGMVLTAVYGVPVLKKFVSMFINQKTGIPIAHGEKGFTKNLNPEKGVQMASFEQLAEWLSVKNKEAFNGIKNGFTGFCENIKNLGGDLMKCFNILDNKSKGNLDTIAKTLGHKEANNENILEVIEKAKDNPIIDNLKELFVHDKKKGIINPLLTKASHSKSTIEFASIATAAFILGGLLPWFNIQHTKKLYKDKKAENTDLKANPAKMLPPTNNINMVDKFRKFQESGQIS